MIYIYISVIIAATVIIALPRYLSRIQATLLLVLLRFNQFLKLDLPQTNVAGSHFQVKSNSISAAVSHCCLLRASAWEHQSLLAMMMARNKYAEDCV